jgi:alpha-glucosidase
MKALTYGHFRGLDGNAALFDLTSGPATAPLATLRIVILEGDIGRVTLRRREGYRLDRGWAIAPNRSEPPFEGRPRDDISGFANPTITVSETDGVVSLAAPGLRADVRLDPFGISWHRAGEDTPFLSDRRTQAYFLSLKTGAVAHFIERHEDERHYGLGDKTGPLDRTGRRFSIDAVDPCGFDAELSDPLYKMLPFYIVDGARGAHGIFYDNLALGSVDLGCTIDNYHGLFRSYRAEDGDLDYYVLAGPTLSAVTQRFSWLTGGQAFTPRWSLGFAMTTMTIADAPDADARITGFIEDCRRHGIRCDSFHFGSGYTSIGNRRYAFNWNRDKFPDPAATMARLKAAGMQPVTNLKPCLLDDHPRLDDAIERQALVMNDETGSPAVAQFWDGLGFHIDFTSPNGRKWWAEGIRDALLAYGVTSIWSDNNEYEIWDEDTVCAGDGRPYPQALARPAQALLMHKLAYETQATQAPGKRPYTITRAGGAGIARYGQTWSGDNETAWKSLRYNLTQGLNMSLSGLYNIGHDVGGFHGPSPGPELFCRFVEFCALWPRMVMNSWKASGIVNLPWMHLDVLPQVRSTIDLRYSLMPYLYTQMWRAALDDVPPVRPLMWDFGSDSTAVSIEDAFMLGPDLLVAPVLEEGATTRDVYLPAQVGGWYDWHSGAAFDGGRTITVEAPLGRLPVFARAGAIIPTETAMGLTVVVFGASAGGRPGLVYVDDGDTADWRSEGSVIELRLRADATEFVLDVIGGNPLVPMTVRGVDVPNLRIAHAAL